MLEGFERILPSNWVDYRGRRSALENELANPLLLLFNVAATLKNVGATNQFTTVTVTNHHGLAKQR